MKTLINYDCPTVIINSNSTLFDSFTNIETITENLFLVHIRLSAVKKEQPPVCRVEWSIPAVDIHSLWHPGTDRNKALQVDWGDGFQSKSTSLAPVASLYNLEGRNRMTFAFTDALNNVSIKAGIHEEDSTFLCSVTLFEEAMPKLDHYEATLRIDRRDIPFYKAIEDVTEWWECLPGYEPAAVPEVALGPMYSTWYSYHQKLTAAELEEQCRLAKELGCDTIIVDDGWQTDDNNRGYAYTGDWEVYAGKIPDMKAHVDTVHRLGMKYMLWYSVPFVGKRSKVWSKFENKLLRVDEKLNTGVLDPRYPDVREYLINTYEQAVSGWDIDGLKLDFVDSFRLSPDQKEGTAEGRDYESVPEAVDRLLSDVMERLRAIKPDILIEFRQTYIGPLMRKYGNMFRANDCPNDSIQNRIRTLDLRLLSGNTAVHSDMIMFNPKESVESAAMQLINVLFSVPQISVRLDEIGEAYVGMLRFWLSFCKENSDILLKGKLVPEQPELLYPLVSSQRGGTKIVAVYANIVVPMDATYDRFIVANGTYNEQVVVRCHHQGRYDLTVKNCCGQIVLLRQIELQDGLYELPIARAGLVILQRIDDSEGI
ncbi:glycoside hydrolase family 36 protein [Paenibacillus taichungensis]|uniref:glycoside hydrolase family 36 protein n=1 Tax=Paenibacillus taichungensis TaxID=484184 RepID=UPI0039A722D9